MKKIICIFVMLSILWIAATNVFASGTENNRVPSMIGDVYAKYENGTEREKALVQNGRAEIEVGGNKLFVVENIPKNDVVLDIVAIPESEEEAWLWFRNLLSDDLNLIAIYDIHFEDSKGERINAKNVTISMQSMDKEDVLLYSVDLNGTVNKLEYSISKGKLEFKADGGFYYILAEKGNEEVVDSSENTDNSKPTNEAEDTNNPGEENVGDYSELTICIILVSISIILILCSRRKIVKKRS